MSATLFDPPHIKKAKEQLLQMGYPPQALPHLLAAIDLAKAAYYTTPQAAQTSRLKHQRDQTQDELEKVSEQLLKARRKIAELQDENTISKAVEKPIAKMSKTERRETLQVYADMRAEISSLRKTLKGYQEEGKSYEPTLAEALEMNKFLRKQLDDAKEVTRVGTHKVSVSWLMRRLRKIIRLNGEKGDTLANLTRLVEVAEAILSGHEPANYSAVEAA